MNKKLVNLTSEFADISAKLADAAVQMLTCAAVGCSVSEDYILAAKRLKTLESLSRDIWAALQQLQEIEDANETDTTAAAELVEEDWEAMKEDSK